MRQARHERWDRLDAAEKWVLWSGWSAATREAIWSQLSEADRLLLIKRGGDAPDACGPAMGNSPARGRLMAFMPTTIRRDARGEDRQVEAGYRGRHAARVADAFDRMEEQARRSDPKGAPLFLQGQVDVARDYARLVERHACAGIRGISLEVMAQRGAGGGGEFIDAVIHDARLIDRYRVRIGDGLALAVRRVRPSRRGNRVGITHRHLVDQVCIAGRTVSEVLEGCGWSKKGDQVQALRSALCACLDRMRGAAPRYGCVTPHAERGLTG